MRSQCLRSFRFCPDRLQRKLVFLFCPTPRNDEKNDRARCHHCAQGSGSLEKPRGFREDKLMSFSAWKQWFTIHRTTAPMSATVDQRRPTPRFRPRVEALEDRWVPALTINLAGAATQVAAGRNLTYTIQLSTDSGDRMVVLDDLLPANTTFVSASQTAGATQLQALLPPV